jgi:hypothetical protein
MDLKRCIGVMRHLKNSPDEISDVQWSVPIDRADEIADELQAAFEAEWDAHYAARKDHQAEVAELKAEQAPLGSEADRKRLDAGWCLLRGAAKVVMDQHAERMAERANLAEADLAAAPDPAPETDITGAPVGFGGAGA